MKERIESIDFIKGVLLVFMTIIHVERLFIEEIGFTAEIQPLIRFTTRAFIVFSGFVISYHYYDKWLQSSREVGKRLVFRGIKLCLLFLLLNLALIACFKILKPGMHLGANSIISNPLFAFGVSSTVATFEILLPISYMLILSPLVLLALQKGWGQTTLVVLLLLFPLMNLLELTSFYNLQLVCYGMVGILGGEFLKRRQSSLTWFKEGWRSGAAVTFVLFLFYLTLSKVGSKNVHMSVVGGLFHMCWIVAAMTFLFRASAVIERFKFLHRNVVDFGRYSLFIYIVQITSLRVIGLLDLPFSGWSLITVVFCLNLAIVWTALRLLMALTRTYGSANRVYKVIFA